MYDAPWNALSRRRVAVFVAIFLGSLLLGAIVVGVEFHELHRNSVGPVAIAKAEALANHRRALDAQFREARDRRAVAQRRADAAELLLFDFLNDRFVDSTERVIESHRPEAQRPPVRRVVQPNPEWDSLNRQVSNLHRQRVQLLEKLTPAHPTVQALDSQIAKLQDQLAETPRDLPANANAIAEAPVENNSTAQPNDSPFDTASHAGGDPSAANPPSAEVERNYRDLLVAAGQARDAYRAAVAAETDVWNVLQRGGSPQIAMDSAGTFDLRANDAESAPLAKNESPFPIGAIALLTLFSLLAAVIVGCRVERPALTFMSAEEIEAALGLPVFGRLGPDENCRENAA